MSESASTSAAFVLSPRMRRRLLILCVLGWLLRIAVAVEYEARHPLADRPVIDEASYERWALEIAGGDLLGDEVFFQEPLYPYALGLVYALAGPAEEPAEGKRVASPRQRTCARHAQAFLGALVVAGVFLLTLRLFGGAAATLAGFAAATYRPLLLFPSLLLKPNLFLPILLALSLLLLTAPLRGDRRSLGPWFLAGVLAGAGALLRGNLLLLLPLLILWPLARSLASRSPSGFARRASLGTLAGASLVLLPVVLRNHHVGGVLALTTSGAGTNLYGGNNSLNPRGRPSEPPWVRGIPAYEADDWRREAERRVGRGLDAGDVSRYWMRETWSSALADPGLHASILWNKLRLSLGAYEVPDNHSLEWDASHLLLLSLPWPGFALWGWLGLAGALAWSLGGPGGRATRADGDPRGLLVLLFVYLITIVLTVTSMRVRLGLVVLLLPFAGWLLSASVARGPRLLGRWARWLDGEEPDAAAGVPTTPLSSWKLGLALGLAACFVFLPVLSAEEVREDFDEREFNYAVYLLEEPQGLARAEAIATVLERRYPGTTRVETLLAEIAYRRAVALRSADGASSVGERQALLNQALGRLRGVVRAEGVAPREAFRARAVAGLVQLEAGDGEAAEDHLRRALGFDPSDARLRFALANALWVRALDALEGDEREGLLRSAEELLSELLAEAEDAAVRRRREEVRALLAVAAAR